jgi:molybdate transport system substrate-binding protein
MFHFGRWTRVQGKPAVFGLAGLLALPLLLLLGADRGGPDEVSHGAGHARVETVWLSSLAENPYWPPWSGTQPQGKDFTIDLIDNAPDLHGDIIDPQLIVFFAGNQFMVVSDLMAAFKEDHPQIRRIYVETLPPGILEDQMAQGTLVIGNLRLAVGTPDIFTGGKGRIAKLQKDKDWFSDEVDYARNRLAIMVARGNPGGVHALADLGRDSIRVSMPNPQWEGIGGKIVEAYHEAGGADLVKRIMTDKVEDGTTFLTHIHHRQTPLRLMLGMSDAGPVWDTEARFQMKRGHPIELIEIPARYNVIVTYTAGVLKQAPHPEAAKDFLAFLTSARGQAVYRSYGFLPP